jgi:mannose/cellobiose epimerase-like protein (N-acyl-D-glucosamine 2-epimerase family)
LNNAETSAAEFKSWLIQTALPRWHTIGWDNVTGGFVEDWHADGKPNPAAIRRLRVQARQIYSFAHAAALGWYPQGLSLALKGFEWLMAKGWSPDAKPGFVHKLNQDGSIADPRRDSYDHMFVLLALSWLWKVSGDARVRSAFERTLDYVDSELTDPGGTLYEGEPRALPRRQNPNMHGFEAMLALHETGIRSDGLKRAKPFLDRFHATFFDASNKVVHEDFGASWQRLPPPVGNRIEPGHCAEWVWLLRRHSLLSGTPAGSTPSGLFAKVKAMALPATGLLPDECATDGSVRRATSRIWTLTEYLKAAIMEAEAGDASARGTVASLLDQLKAAYRDPAPEGGWIDQVYATGQPIRGPIPASILYHLFAAVVEADRVFLQAKA